MMADMGVRLWPVGCACQSGERIVSDINSHIRAVVLKLSVRVIRQGNKREMEPRVAVTEAAQ